MGDRVKDLLALPDQIRKGDFVLKLGEGLEHVEETVRTYVVTPGLAEAFDRALKLVGSALADGRSVAAYLHGSFGSGKSHFMALLSLMLDGNEVVWKVPELHGLKDKHPYLGQAKLLQLHFHMVGQNSIEEAIFRRYVDHVLAEHPEAPVPNLFGDEKLFEDARRLLDELGDEAFFAKMSEPLEGLEGWGALQAEGLWSRERFEACAGSGDPKERGELFSALVKTRFGSYASESHAFVDLDSGLARMAEHASSLGYQGVVLFLDELILWLAHRASDSEWLHNEVQKMVKLVEAQEASRAVPLVSFIARQRDLVAMVGETNAGSENVRLRDSLKHWEGRYDTITLEDRNLPAIVERRVRRPKDDAAQRALDEAFGKLKKSAKAAWDTLLGEQDAEAFAKLYPFSPALVEALVALSNSLQRERTAIKLLMELLVEHIEDLHAGEVVGVGDLYDVLAGGEDSADGIMKNRFEAAKQLYKYQLLPVIQQNDGTATPERCQRLRADHPVRLGCSNCGEKACRTDNALAKTLLIAALVPRVKSLENLTVSRLVQLNHGVLKVPIPGTEGGLALQKLRNWASQVGQIRIGEGTDPKVSIALTGVDLKPIIEQARQFDTDGARQRVLRDLLFDALGVSKIADSGKDHKVEWRKSDRIGHIRFGNVRNFGPEQLRCPEDHDWRLIVDYPFDQPGFGPRHDDEALDKYLESGTGTWTLVWLPSFFSKEMNDMLGELVVLEHILDSDASLRQYIAHLSVENQSRAKLDLENLRSQKEQRLHQVLEQAYGVAQVKEGNLDTSQLAEEHLRVLKSGARIEPRLAANLSDAVDAYVSALLEKRYPRHPAFGTKLTRQRVERLVALFGEIIDSEDKWLPADRERHVEAQGTLGALGLVLTPEGRVRLREDGLLQQIENSRRKHGVDQPSVAQVRHWVDENDKMGLKPEAADLVVRCYARYAARTLVRYDKAHEVKPGTPLPDDVVLDKPDLPELVAWNKALGLAGAVFGIALAGKALHADNLKRFEDKLNKALVDGQGPCERLPAVLKRRADELGVADEEARLQTARSGAALCAALKGQPAVQQVRVLADFVPQTSAQALGRSVGSAKANVEALENNLVFGVFAQLEAQRSALPGAEELLERVARALRQDELNEVLAASLRGVAEEGQRLLAPAPTPIKSKPQPGHEVVRREASGLAEVKKLIDELRHQVEEQGEAVVSLATQITLRVKSPSDES
ncbi:MAG: hypothetical protein R3B72_37885 [Polyangiaceae bacterium]